MMENLKTTKYRDGSLIIYVSSAAGWESKSSLGNYAWPEFSISNKNYGAIYDWATLETGKIAPQGWRIPTEDDWNELFDTWDECALIDPTYWNLSMDYVCINGEINTTGYSAQAAGYIDSTGESTFQNGAYWWLSEGLIRNIYFSRSWTRRLISDKIPYIGSSIRCIKE